MIDDVEKLRKKIRQYANAMIWMTGFIVGFVLGAMTL